MKYKRPSTFTDRAFYLMDSIIQRVGYAVKQSPRNFCEVETTDPDIDSIVYDDGSLATIVELEGGMRVVGEDEFDELVEKLNNSFISYLSDGSHNFTFYFSRDPDGIEDELEDLYRGSRIACRKMELDIEDIIDEQIKVLGKYTQVERCFIILHTNINGLSPEEKKQALKKRTKNKIAMPLAKNAQDIGGIIEDIRERHRSFTNGFCNDVKNLGIMTKILDVHTSIKEMRVSVDPQFTADDWSAFLPGDPLPLRVADDAYSDASNCLWPRIEDQIFPRNAIQVDGHTVQIGDRFIAPVSVELGPKVPKSFQVLFSRLNREAIPWRIAFKVNPNGADIMAMKSMLASIMAFTPGTTNNKWLMNAQEQILALRDNGHEIAKLQISAATWGPANDQPLIDKRRAILTRMIQGWGACDVAAAEGDPLETFISSSPGIIKGSIANPMAPPMLDAMKMMPITRPASPFKFGSQLFRTPDGKLLPYQPYSKLQTAWITLIFAPMGFGKSVLMNSSHLALILSADLDELPFISIIDIGPSSKGLIQLIKNGLPEDKKHLAMYSRIRNKKEYSINVFDTLLGNREPISNHFSFLVNFLCYLATPIGKEFPYDGIQGMADAVIKKAYKSCATRKSAKQYIAGINAEVDQKLKKIGFKVNEKTTQWWDVVDYLYKEGHSHHATLAQRYAVPTLGEVANFAKQEDIRAIYSGVTETQELLPDYFWRTITEAMNIYPLLSEPTQFDLGEARIVSLDLDEVAKGEGADAKKRTGLMYMLAYRVLTSKFFLGKDHMDEVESKVGIYKIDYRPYHQKFIDSIAKLPKRFCVDEKHRVNGLKQVEDQFLTATREGRKWKVEIMLASQLPEDFGKDMINLATTTFILGAGSDRNADAVKEEFKLNDTMDYLLRNEIVKPTAA
ncbi:MAG: hypothetical protein QM500_12065, partial [Methylococcales bacterium]